VAPELLAPVDVREVNLDHRHRTEATASRRAIE